MKIAIKGHASGGKEVIQILESLGGVNIENLTGTFETFYYVNDKNEIVDDHKKNLDINKLTYTRVIFGIGSNFKNFKVMWPFSYFKRKKEEALEKKRQEELHQLQLRKEKYNRYKEYIDSVVSQFKSEEENKRYEHIDKIREENKVHNQTCPNCNSENIIQVFRRHKGELHGSLNSYSSHTSYLFESHSSHESSGKIDGNLDTLKVNQCKDCGQEWEHKNEKQMIYSSDWYSGKCDRYENVSSFLRRVWYLIEDVEKYDPNKLDNPCNSVQEFIEMKKEEICKYWGRGVLDLSMEVLHYYARCNSFYLTYADEILEEYTKDDGGKLYLGKFTPKMEDFLINKFGFKYHFNG